MTVNDMMDRMTAAEETSWLAYYAEEPFGAYRSDVMMAQIAQLLHNVNVKKDKQKKLTDFLPFYKKQIKEDPDVSTKVRDIFGKVAKHMKGKK